VLSGEALGWGTDSPRRDIQPVLPLAWRSRRMDNTPDDNQLDIGWHMDILRLW
jgi:hypothetical protein